MKDFFAKIVNAKRRYDFHLSAPSQIFDKILNVPLEYTTFFLMTSRLKLILGNFEWDSKL